MKKEYIKKKPSQNINFLNRNYLDENKKILTSIKICLFISASRERRREEEKRATPPK